MAEMRRDLTDALEAALKEPISPSLLRLLGGNTEAARKIMGDGVRISYVLSEHGLSADDQIAVVASALFIVLSHLPSEDVDRHVDRVIQFIRPKGGGAPIRAERPH